MFLSIITVTLNNRTGLKKTANSLKIQTCQDFEWIIVDGASNDGTTKDLKNYNARIISEPDDGIYDAMNKGIDIARGDYLLFLNAGDSLAQKITLEEIQAAARLKNPGFIYGDSWESTAGKLYYKASRSHQSIVTGMFTHHQSMIYKRNEIAAIRYNSVYKIASDYEFTLSFLNQDKDIIYLKTPICIFASGGVSQQEAKTGRKEQFQIRKAFNALPAHINACVYLLHFLTWTLRKYAPSIYWVVKKL